MPKEHGAWAMLLVPYITGAAVAGRFSLDSLMGLAGVVLLYLARPPAMLLLKKRIVDGSWGPDPRSLLAGSLVFALPGLTVFIWLWLARGHDGIIFLAIVALAALALHSWFSLRRKERSAAGEFAGIALLTLTAPLGNLIAAGGFESDGLKLWAINMLYFGASVYYVKLKLRASTRLVKKRALRADGTFPFGVRLSLARSALIYLGFMSAALTILIFLGAFPWPVFIAFLPAAAWSLLNIVSLRPEPRIKREGIIQTLLAAYFLVMIVVAFRSF